MATKKLGIYFGAISDPLSTQLRKQKYLFDKEKVKHFQRDIDALNRLRIRGYITDSQTDAATGKLYKKIERHVIEANGLTKAVKTK